jgi:predicted alpha/beta hydrolase family esterase
MWGTMYWIFWLIKKIFKEFLDEFLMKKIVIVHGSGANPEKAWYSWLGREMESRGCEVAVPRMPKTNLPKIEKWVETIGANVDLGQDSYLVGHCLGCKAILKYVSQFQLLTKINRIVLVAPFDKVRLEGVEARVMEGCLKVEEKYNFQLPSFIKKLAVGIIKRNALKWNREEIDWEQARKNCMKYLCLFSDNDRYSFREEVDLFREKLDAETIIIPQGGHLGNGEGYFEFPLLRDKLIEMISR